METSPITLLRFANLSHLSHLSYIRGGYKTKGEIDAANYQRSLIIQKGYFVAEKPSRLSRVYIQQRESSLEDK